MTKQKLWFRAKTYGWGWYPSTWQGFLVILVWAIIFTFLVIRFTKTLDFVTNYSLIFISLVILIYICYKKGEKPKWRWGKKK